MVSEDKTNLDFSIRLKTDPYLTALSKMGGAAINILGLLEREFNFSAAQRRLKLHDRTFNDTVNSLMKKGLITRHGLTDGARELVNFYLGLDAEAATWLHLSRDQLPKRIVYLKVGVLREDLDKGAIDSALHRLTGNKCLSEFDGFYRRNTNLLFDTRLKIGQNSRIAQKVVSRETKPLSGKKEIPEELSEIKILQEMDQQLILAIYSGERTIEGLSKKINRTEVWTGRCLIDLRNAGYITRTKVGKKYIHGLNTERFRGVNPLDHKDISQYSYIGRRTRPKRIVISRKSPSFIKEPEDTLQYQPPSSIKENPVIHGIYGDMRRTVDKDWHLMSDVDRKETKGLLEKWSAYVLSIMGQPGATELARKYSENNFFQEYFSLPSVKKLI
jgi:predicted transcriptional regulator